MNPTETNLISPENTPDLEIIKSSASIEEDESDLVSGDNSTPVDLNNSKANETLIQQSQLKNSPNESFNDLPTQAYPDNISSTISPSNQSNISQLPVYITNVSNGTVLNQGQPIMYSNGSNVQPTVILSHGSQASGSPVFTIPSNSSGKLVGYPMNISTIPIIGNSIQRQHGIPFSFQQSNVHPSIQPSLTSSYQWKKTDSNEVDHSMQYQYSNEIYLPPRMELQEGHTIISGNYYISPGVNQIEIRNPPILMPTIRTPLESWFNDPSCNAEYWQSHGVEPQDSLIFRALPKEWYICTKPEQVIQKYNHINVPKQELIMNPANFPKAFAKLIPTRKNAKIFVPIDVQNFHIYLYCWHAIYKNSSSFPDRIPRMSHLFVNMQKVFKDVVSKYGYVNVCQSEGVRGWLSVFKGLPNYSITITNYTSRLKDYYNRYLLDFENRVAYFSVKPRKLNFKIEGKEPFFLDWDYYLHDTAMRDVDIYPKSYTSTSIKVLRHIIELGIDLELENQEDNLKKLPPTESFHCGDIAYSFERKTLILCHTPSENPNSFENLFPLLLVGRLSGDIFETLDSLRTEYLKPLFESGGTVTIELLPDLEEALDDEDEALVGKKDKRLPPPIIKWGESPPTHDKKRKGIKASDLENDIEPVHGETPYSSSEVDQYAGRDGAIAQSGNDNSEYLLNHNEIEHETSRRRKKQKYTMSYFDDDGRESKKRRIDENAHMADLSYSSNDHQYDEEGIPSSPSSADSFESSEQGSLKENESNAAVQTRITFGTPIQTLGIRYKFSGFSDDEYRYIPQNINELRSEDYLQKSKIIQILQNDNVPVDQLREIRYYFKGPNEFVSGWLLVDDKFKFKIPKHDHYQAPILNLKLSFNENNSIY